MKTNRYEEYWELMKIAYPNSSKRFADKGTQGKYVQVDSKKSFGALNDYVQESIIRSLGEQILAGKRRLADKDNDDYNIIKRR